MIRHIQHNLILLKSVLKYDPLTYINVSDPLDWFLLFAYVSSILDECSSQIIVDFIHIKIHLSVVSSRTLKLSRFVNL